MPLFSSVLLSVASVLTLFLLAVAAPLRAADAPPAGLPHTLALPAGPLAYRAIWTETVLHDKAGVPQATISTTAYLREGVANAATRPVLFAFNGGPGASSSPLHTGLLGPRLAGKADAQGRRIFTDNPDTLLDIADIVLIDPVGTGFNRELQPGGMQAYLNVDGDAAATQAVIRAWLTQHGRTASPVFIAGESYGGYRLATMVRTMADLNIRGVVLISPALDFSVSPDQRFIFELPSLAAAAFAHGKVNQAGRTVEQVFEEARAYAQGDYAVALQQGDLLAASDRARVAQRVAALVGLPAATIEQNNLRMPSQAFVEQLVPGSVLGRIDTRVVAPKPEKALVAGRSKAADDPALGMGKSNVIKSAALRDYLVEATGWQGERDYVSLSLDLNFAWDWRGRSAKFEDNTPLQATPGLVAFMQAKPQARLLLMGAYYDLATPWLGQQYALTHSGLPQERIAMQAFAAGHAVYDDKTRASAAQLLRRFIEKAR
jgi:carboxypeptidase C (cathepsin A)